MGRMGRVIGHAATFDAARWTAAYKATLRRQAAALLDIAPDDRHLVEGERPNGDPTFRLMPDGPCLVAEHGPGFAVVWQIEE